jgi:hypothetical protein
MSLWLAYSTAGDRLYRQNRFSQCFSMYLNILQSRLLPAAVP